MDRYQEKIFRTIDVVPAKVEFHEVINKSGDKRTEAYKNVGYFKGLKFDKSNRKFVITQDEDYHHTVYTFTIAAACLQDVIIKKAFWELHAEPVVDRCFYVTVDFEDKCESLTLIFKDNIVDPITIPVEFIDADKEVWDRKVRIRQEEERNKIVDIKWSASSSLVNIFFNPIDDSYDHAKVTLYRVAGAGKGASYRLLACYSVPRNSYFAAIDSLAPGRYAFVLEQFARGDTSIYQSGKNEFEIRIPVQPIGKGIVNWP